MLHHSRILSVACQKFLRSNHPRPIAKPLVSVALMILLFAGSIPPAIASSLAREAVTRSSNALERASMSASSSLISLKGPRQQRRDTARAADFARSEPRPPESKANREGRVPHVPVLNHFHSNSILRRRYEP
jgi:hypothetical protein